MMVVFHIILATAAYIFNGIDGVLNFVLGVCIAIVMVALVFTLVTIFRNLYTDVRAWLLGW
jgi:hypothetical protein